VLSAANEVAVGAFVEGRIAFGEISHIIEATMDRVERGEPTLEAVRAADRKARETATAVIETIERPSRC
jgi:1-deoxy-D-xylulose-5-phosphate reductoisomerase